MKTLILIFGLIIGSFLNVCIYRIPVKKSLVFPRSSCQYCNRILGWYELIPVLSYLLQFGKCRQCRSHISLQYPLVEILTGVLFLFSYLIYGLTMDFWTAIILASLMIVVAFIDIEHKIIPNKLVIAGLTAGILLGLFRPGAGILFILKGFSAGFLPMFMIAVISRGQMGFGDVKLAGVMGVFLGWKAVLAAVFLAFTGGAVYGIFLMIFLGKSRKTAVPFGPFLAGAAIISFLWLDELASWYIRLIM